MAMSGDWAYSSHAIALPLASIEGKAPLPGAPYQVPPCETVSSIGLPHTTWRSPEPHVQSQFPIAPFRKFDWGSHHQLSSDASSTKFTTYRPFGPKTSRPMVGCRPNKPE